MIEWSLVIACVAGVASWFAFRRVVLGNWWRWFGAFAVALASASVHAQTTYNSVPINDAMVAVVIDWGDRTEHADYNTAPPQGLPANDPQDPNGQYNGWYYSWDGGNGASPWRRIAGGSATWTYGRVYSYYDTNTETFVETQREVLDSVQITARYTGESYYVAADVDGVKVSKNATIAPAEMPSPFGNNPAAAFHLAGTSEAQAFAIAVYVATFAAGDENGPTTQPGQPATRPAEDEQVQDDLESVNPLQWTADMFTGWADELAQTAGTGSPDDPIQPAGPFVEIAEAIEQKWDESEGTLGIVQAWQHLTGTMEIYPNFSIGGIYVPAYDWINNSLAWMIPKLTNQQVLWAFGLIRQFLVIMVIFWTIRVHLRLTAYTFKIITPTQTVGL